MRKGFLMLATVLAVAACSSGSNDGADGAPAIGGNAVAAVPDAFMADVIALVNRSSDSSEPETTAALTATSPENSEPVPVMLLSM